MSERLIPISTTLPVWTKSTCFDSSNTSWRRIQMYVLSGMTGITADRQEIVIHRDGKDLTLQQVFESLNLTAYDLSIDTLDMHAHQVSFLVLLHIGYSWQCRNSTDSIDSMIDTIQLDLPDYEKSSWRLIICSRANTWLNWLRVSCTTPDKGHELIMLELITDLEQSKYQQSEWRLSIYGR